MSRDNGPPSPPPTVRDSQLAIDQGPIYQALARELADRLHAAYTRAHDPEYREACGIVALDCDAVVAGFALWRHQHNAVRATWVRDWQEVKNRARKLGLEVT